jgi:hypothetical protein
MNRGDEAIFPLVSLRGAPMNRGDEAISVETGGVEKNRVDPIFINSILIFRCYTSSSKRKRERAKRTQEIRLIDKDGEGIYNERRCGKKKWRRWVTQQWLN